MESGFSSILPLIPRKNQYPYSSKTAYQIQADFVEARESFYADFSSLLQVSPSYYDRRFPAAAKADAGKARTPLNHSPTVKPGRKNQKREMLSLLYA